jgi:hypothetical protein
MQVKHQIFLVQVVVTFRAVIVSGARASPLPANDSPAKTYNLPRTPFNFPREFLRYHQQSALLKHLQTDRPTSRHLLALANPLSLTELPHRPNATFRSHRAIMSSEFDMFFEEFLNGNFDTGLADNYQFPFDAQVQQDSGDFQMLDLPAGDFQDFGNEALAQTTELDPNNGSPWGADVASDQLPGLQEAAFDFQYPYEPA